eukprot:TRINITY_DN101877_c0_g1_i1.p1 TRINITY_DN101877_c0_g1~~TRINITY_DN101877_c0_g1_i1.p1  ORF type:complete len:635 (+),score=101.00 TRINITY_DN101877_c0_g1_i1:98-2002(+)
MTLHLMSMGGGTGATPRSARSPGAVPFLPGYTPHEVLKDSYNKKQTLAYAPGGPCDQIKVTSNPAIAVTKGGLPPKLDMTVLETLQDPYHRFNYSARAMSHDERSVLRESARNSYRPSIAPAWLKHDRQVLRFFAYFQEPVHEDPKENCRVRRCTVFFYLEDGTMMVTEPKVENSGIPQGTFVKRHRIPKHDGGFYSYHDLKCGMTINVYSRAFRLTDCDDFTRAFLQKAVGSDPGPAEEQPLETYRKGENLDDATMTSRMREIVESKEYNELAAGGSRKNAKLQQYLENDRKVLSFKCFWDDPTRYGARMYYVLHYYLSDDTVEMLECLARNSGRDPYPVFWRRAPLRWNPHVSPAPGMLEPEPITYKPEDLIVGRSVTVYGRDIMLYDCDEFTRYFYREYLGHEQDGLPIEEPIEEHVKLSHPPHTGFGTEDDSLASCLHLTPRVPRRDILKLMNEQGKILRFEAQITNTRSEDVSRRFVIGLYVADNSIGVWEIRQRNSGHTEGKFASRSRKKNVATGRFFEPCDFVVGTTIEINGTPFHIIRADEATMKYMEKHCIDFPHSDVALVTTKMEWLRGDLRQMQHVSAEQLGRLADKNSLPLSEHELETLSRAYGDASTGMIPTAKLLASGSF